MCAARGMADDGAVVRTRTRTRTCWRTAWFASGSLCCTLRPGRIRWRGVSAMAWGLALSGGSVLGAAHLGVLRAFREWGLAPDVLAGASAGGLVAGVVAAGARLEDVVRFGIEVGRRPLDYLRPRVVRLAAELLPGDTLPPADSLFDSAPLVRGLVALCPHPHRIEAWQVSTALTAVDLASLEGVAFVGGFATNALLPRGRWRVEVGGDLHVALQATMAMPGVFSPVRGPSVLLVDGGVADDLPVDWAAALGAARVVAVDVAASGPVLPPRAGIGWVLGRTADYMTATLSRLRRPARFPVLTLLPDTAGISGFAFGEFERLVELGYAAARTRQGEIQAFVRG